MDPDIKYIIDEESKLLRKLEECKAAARERVARQRDETAAFRNSELEKIRSEYNRMSESRLLEIKKRMEDDLEDMRRVQGRLLEDVALKNKVTGRIVSVILENRS